MKAAVSELLFEHDCVIIPGFGAFISNLQPASTSPDSNKIHPPSKKIAFNPSLVSNDGLLAHHLSTQNSISFSDALKRINIEVAQIKKELETGNSVLFPEIGNFSLNADRKISFEPLNTLNYNLSTYGFKPIDLFEVNRVEAEPSIEKKIAAETIKFELEEEAPGYMEHPAVKSGKHKKILLYSLSAYMPVLAIIWILFIYKEPFTGTQQSKIVPVETQPKVELIEEESIPNKSNTIEPKENIKPEVSVTQAVKPEPTAENNTEIVRTESSVIVNQRSGRYYVIGGSFNTLNRAEILLNEFKNQNFTEANIISASNRYRVSYFSSEDYTICYQKLKSIRSENKAAWILKY